MATLFPHFPSQSFAPFFREFDSIFPSESFIPRSQLTRPFNPRFDVREAANAYELQGELPGVKQENIDIEFVDANTIVIKGKIEQESTRDNSIDVKGKAIDNASPETVTADNASESSSTYHKATVEDDYVDAGAEKENPTATAQELTPTSNETVAAPAKEEQPGYKYWVQERSVGEFQRTFSFPGKVSQDAKASLKNGILSVVVPKAVKQEKKIAIE